MVKPRSKELLDWYDNNARVLPWRVPPPNRKEVAHSDPYLVWLSEIMLQQTVVATVIPYFEKFIKQWPSVEILANADLNSILQAWSGLGYYARARNLHKCARIIVKQYNGRFPDSEKKLLMLPGIGPYTASAILAIAFEKPATVVVGNVERVITRLFAISGRTPEVKSKIKSLAGELTPKHRCGDYAQAIMDLGATICSPRSPKCIDCPWLAACKARSLSIENNLPTRLPRKKKVVREGLAFLIVRTDGAILLRRRPEQGLLGGMMEVPSTNWAENGLTHISEAPLDLDWLELPGKVTHTFTHFKLELKVYKSAASEDHQLEGLWVLPEKLKEQALPTLTKKVIKHANLGL